MYYQENFDWEFRFLSKQNRKYLMEDTEERKEIEQKVDGDQHQTVEILDDDDKIIENFTGIFHGMYKESRVDPSGTTYNDRQASLKILSGRLLEEKEKICEAVSADFGNRAAKETLIAEIFTTYRALKYISGNLKSWMKMESRSTSWLLFPASSKIHYQPLGVVGILSPWNYPINLALVPVIYALAAGNRVLLKPSEKTPKTSALLKELLESIFPVNQLFVVLGGPKVATAFSSLPFDHLLYTGSSVVGRLVAKAAAENMTPVTLELGGKCPAIVDDMKLTEAAYLVAYGKLNNAGQTCIAPDYALVHSDKAEMFVKALNLAVEKMFPTMLNNEDFSSVIDSNNYNRLMSYIEDAEKKGAVRTDIKPDGEELPDKESRKFPLIVLQNVNDDMMLMKEEIFGPLLPIMTYNKFEDVISYINRHDRPLCVYYLGTIKTHKRWVIENTVAGQTSINDVIVHFANDDLPFGGVGESGVGRYRGSEGFKTFSNAKSVFYQSSLAQVSLFRPPYTTATEALMKFFIGK